MSETHYKLFDFENDNLRLGITQIDEQHKHLVDMTNDLNDFLSKKLDDGWQKEILLTLVDMLNYSKMHFSYEEKIMSTIDYLRFNNHKERHEEFINVATEKLKNFENITIQDARNLLYFLRDWLVTHIAFEDKLYVQPIKNFLKKTQGK